MESTQQDSGRAARYRCQRSKGVQSAPAPLGLCDNLINGLKLLANQQTDGYSRIQSIVTGLQERSRKSIMDGLRSFIEIDNQSALDVGRLRKGLRPFFMLRSRNVVNITQRLLGKEQMISH